MALSAHGTRVLRNGTAIVGVQDVTPPPLLRKFYERTRLASVDDEWRAGIRRAGELSFDLLVDPNFDPTQTGLIDAWETVSVDAWIVAFADGAQWGFQGSVESLAPSAPVDGALTLRVTVRPVGAIDLHAAPAGASFLLQEDGFYLLLETGDKIIL